VPEAANTDPRPSAPPAAGPDPGSHAAYLGRRYFTELDGLRFLAMTAVVWNHAGRGDDYFGWGLGVKLFFVISGFLITTLLLREEARRGVISLAAFYSRRSLRIFPLYFAVLALYTGLVAVRLRHTPAGDQFFASLPYYLTFTANWFVSLDAGAGAIFYFAWSLSAQEQFYLLWPAVLRWTRSRWVPVGLMVGAIALGLGFEAQIASGRLDARVLPFRILASFPVSIGLGFLAAYLLHAERGYRVARAALDHAWSPVLGLALMLTQVAWPTTPDVVPTFGALALVLACVVRPANVLAPLLELRLVRHVGTVSLGIYLLHMLAIHAVRVVMPGGSRAAIFLFAYPLSIAAATVSSRWFERPIAGLRRRPGVAAPVTAAD